MNARFLLNFAIRRLNFNFNFNFIFNFKAFDSWTLGMRTTSEFGNAEVCLSIHQMTFDSILFYFNPFFFTNKYNDTVPFFLDTATDFHFVNYFY